MACRSLNTAITRRSLKNSREVGVMAGNVPFPLLLFYRGNSCVNSWLLGEVEEGQQSSSPLCVALGSGGGCGNQQCWDSTEQQRIGRGEERRGEEGRGEERGGEGRRGEERGGEGRGGEGRGGEGRGGEEEEEEEVANS